jgi:hypothetical protein
MCLRYQSTSMNGLLGSYGTTGGCSGDGGSISGRPGGITGGSVGPGGACGLGGSMTGVPGGTISGDSGAAFMPVHASGACSCQ